MKYAIKLIGDLMAKKNMKAKQAQPTTAKRKRKDSNPTQVHPFQMVMIMGPTGKKRMEKRML